MVELPKAGDGRRKKEVEKDGIRDLEWLLTPLFLS